jgi:putative endonuclease
VSWMHHRQLLGRRGEEAAARYLAGAGWHILDRNWRCPDGELDIVARDGSDLVVCEVKTRTSAAFGTPVEAVNWAKLARLNRLAQAWQADRGLARVTARIDILGLLAVGPDRFTIEHVRGCV